MENELKLSELCEEWALANSRECVESGGTAASTHEESEDASEARFTLKYLGSTLVETPSSEEATAEAIKTVITMAKASGKKLQRVSLAVSLRGIRMTDLATEEDQLQVSIYRVYPDMVYEICPNDARCKSLWYRPILAATDTRLRISYCSADATHDHVFAFIATNLNETMECHAFLCPKRKMAQTVTLTVAQAFNTAYEAWQLSQADPRIHHAQDKGSTLTDEKNETNEKKNCSETKNQSAKMIQQNKQNGQQRHAVNEGQKNLLIDLSNDPKPTGNSWVSFEEESSSDSKRSQKNSANSIPMTTLRHTSASTPSHHVVPRPSTGFKMQNAWGESRSVDLMCS
ncbi:low density lipoprotein receptor adapter protein 1-like isoform X1 [Vespula maculifrons]|uniref:Low density lipoprotein receptor adapter protein 1-like isoform X1 n=1 Tax=Vespula maculifrons TaxID=7453 RepID=A0ABD2BWQ0_VESMC